MKGILVFSLGLFFICGFTDAQQPKEPVDQTGKVFEGIAELTINRDKTLKRSAMVAHLEFFSEQPRDKPPILWNGYHIALQNTMNHFDYFGHCRITPLTYREKPLTAENWNEIAKCDGNVRLSDGPANPFRTIEKMPSSEPEKDALKKGSFMPRYYRPFDNICLMTNWMFFYGQNMKIDSERLFLREMQFVDSRFLVQGNVESHWDWEFGDMRFVVTMVQGANCAYLPIEVRYVNLSAATRDYFSHVRIQWKEHHGVWVPDVVNAASSHQYGDRRYPYHWLMKFQWLIGDEVPESLVDCKLNNYRVPLMNAFGIRVMRVNASNPQMMDPPAPWERPEDIEITTPSLLSSDYRVYGVKQGTEVGRP